MTKEITERIEDRIRGTIKVIGETTREKIEDRIRSTIKAIGEMIRTKRVEERDTVIEIIIDQTTRKVSQDVLDVEKGNEGQEKNSQK